MLKSEVDVVGEPESWEELLEEACSDWPKAIAVTTEGELGEEMDSAWWQSRSCESAAGA